MALTESTMVELRSAAPDFSLPDTNGNHISLNDFKSETLVVIFTCNHCPYAKAVEDRLVALGNGYEGRTDFVLISSNDVVNYPEDSPVKMAEKHKLKGYPFPYLFDETQEVAKKYGAVCTPDFFGYNKNLELQYRGRIRELKDLKPVSKGDSDLRTAMEMVTKYGKGPKNQIPSMGCNIKWFK